MGGQRDPTVEVFQNACATKWVEGLCIEESFGDSVHFAGRRSLIAALARGVRC